MTTVSQAIEKREQGRKALIAQYASDFRQVLPAHIKAETFVRLSQGVLRRNADLAKAANNNPGSFLGALLECARLGHEPGTDAFALVPVGGEVQGWEQYQGVIERVYRAGAVRSVKAEVVRKNDPYRFKRSTMQVPEHDPDDFASEDERGPARRRLRLRRNGRRVVLPSRGDVQGRGHEAQGHVQGLRLGHVTVEEVA
jgi:recombination protein RecT